MPVGRRALSTAPPTPQVRAAAKEGLISPGWLGVAPQRSRTLVKGGGLCSFLAATPPVVRLGFIYEGCGEGMEIPSGGETGGVAARKLPQPTGGFAARKPPRAAPLTRS